MKRSSTRGRWSGRGSTAYASSFGTPSIDGGWIERFARTRAAELRVYLVVLDTVRRRAFAVDPDGSIVCGTFDGFELAAFTFERARTDAWRVAPEPTYERASCEPPNLPTSDEQGFPKTRPNARTRFMRAARAGYRWPRPLLAVLAAVSGFLANVRATQALIAKNDSIVATTRASDTYNEYQADG